MGHNFRKSLSMTQIIELAQAKQRRSHRGELNGLTFARRGGTMRHQSPLVYRSILRGSSSRSRPTYNSRQLKRRAHQ